MKQEKGAGNPRNRRRKEYAEPENYVTFSELQKRKKAKNGGEEIVEASEETVAVEKVDILQEVAVEIIHEGEGQQSENQLNL